MQSEAIGGRCILNGEPLNVKGKEFGATIESIVKEGLNADVGFAFAGGERDGAVRGSSEESRIEVFNAPRS